MKTLRAWLKRWAGLFAGASLERERAAELESHLEMQIEDNLRTGMTAEEARRQAILKFGGIDSAKESYREAATIPLIENLLRDVRFGTRQLARNPGFAVVAIGILALGIGASTAIFSAVDPILFKPLPYPQADRIMMIWYAGDDGSREQQAFHNYRELTERSHSFDATTVMKPWTPAMTGEGHPERLDGQQVSAGYFRVLGVQPVLGRDFQPVDDVVNGPKTVILSDGLWRRTFGGDAGIVGQQVKLNDDYYTVIGVMPREFENVMAPSAELWSPLQYDPGQIAAIDTREWGHHLRMAARLRSGVQVEGATTDLNAIARNSVAEFPRPNWSSMAHGVIVDVLQDDVTRGVRPALLAVLGAVILLLMIACVNVTNLWLARGAQRRGEFAMRAALGAERARLVRQLITESVLVAGLGGALGLIVAEAGVRALVALSPAELPRVNVIGVNGAVFAFALGVTALVGLAVGVFPAVLASRSDLHTGMQQSSRRSAAGQSWTRRLLVVAEVALAMVLLVSAGLLLRSMRSLLAVDPGFDGSHLVTMQVHTFARRYNDDNACHRFFAQALDAVRQVPGVTAASFTSQLPLSGDLDGYGLQFEHDDPNQAIGVFRYAVTPGYFQTIGVPLRRGRLLDERDTTGTPHVAVISESLARERFGEQDPIGKSFHMGGVADSPMFTIVGVVGDVRQVSLADTQSNAVYITTTQWHWADGTLSAVVRTHGDAMGLAPAIENAIWSVDKDQPIVRVATVDTLVSTDSAERRFVLTLFELFAVVALILAASGIYGVLSGGVNERTREIGVRVALGASPGDILGLVVWQGMTLTGLGVGLGLVGAAVAGQALISLLFGVSSLDPVTYSGMIALLVSVSGVACWLPAMRAAQVDPSITLRAE